MKSMLLVIGFAAFFCINSSNANNSSNESIPHGVLQPVKGNDSVHVGIEYPTTLPSTVTSSISSSPTTNTSVSSTTFTPSTNTNTPSVPSSVVTSTKNVVPVTTPATVATPTTQQSIHSTATEATVTSSKTSRGKGPESTTPSSVTVHDRQFDGPSFIGGIVLTIGLTAIGFIAFKFYKSEKGDNYRSL